MFQYLQQNEVTTVLGKVGNHRDPQPLCTLASEMPKEIKAKNSQDNPLHFIDEQTEPRSCSTLYVSTWIYSGVTDVCTCQYGSWQVTGAQETLGEWLVWDAKALPLDLWEHQWSRDRHLGQGQPVEPDWGRRRAPCALESRALVPLFSQHCRPPTVFFKETREENITLPFIFFFFFFSFIKHLKIKQNASGAWNCTGANVMSPMSWMNTAHVKTSNTTDLAHVLFFLCPLYLNLLFLPIPYLSPLYNFSSLSPAPASPFSSPLLFYVPSTSSFHTLLPSSSFSPSLLPFIASFPILSSCIFSKCLGVSN